MAPTQSSLQSAGIRASSSSPRRRTPATTARVPSRSFNEQKSPSYRAIILYIIAYLAQKEKYAGGVPEDKIQELARKLLIQLRHRPLGRAYKTTVQGHIYTGILDHIENPDAAAWGSTWPVGGNGTCLVHCSVKLDDLYNSICEEVDETDYPDPVKLRRARCNRLDRAVPKFAAYTKSRLLRKIIDLKLDQEHSNDDSARSSPEAGALSRQPSNIAIAQPVSPRQSSQPLPLQREPTLPVLSSPERVAPNPSTSYPTPQSNPPRAGPSRLGRTQSQLAHPPITPCPQRTLSRGGLFTPPVDAGDDDDEDDDGMDVDGPEAGPSSRPLVSVERQPSVLRHEIRALERRRKSSKEKIDELEVEIMVLRKNESGYKEQLARYKRRLEHLKNQRNVFRLRYLRLKEELSLMQTKYDAQIQDLNQENKKLRKQNEENAIFADYGRRVHAIQFNPPTLSAPVP
ncbi:hypothetical protein C8Q75DRAFT_890278 [Abortiporus biennis]|nr:hypothetical protein C8Q75DRAFT_890278 [Abortiporus biennis]